MESEIAQDESLTPAGWATDAEQVATYRTVSALAIVGLLIGLASPLALVAPLLYTVPIIGIVLSLVAWKRINQPGSGLAGRTAAAVGLVLCVVVLVAAESHRVVANQLILRQARETSSQWFEAVEEGRVLEAMKLTLPDAYGGLVDPRDEKPSATEPSQDSLRDAFVRYDPISRLLSLADRAEVRLVQETPWAGYGRYEAEQIYQVRGRNSEGQADSFGMKVVLVRSRARPGDEPVWRISRILEDITTGTSFSSI